MLVAVARNGPRHKGPPSNDMGARELGPGGGERGFSVEWKQWAEDPDVSEGGCEAHGVAGMDRDGWAHTSALVATMTVCTGSRNGTRLCPTEATR
ncbi:hypothetical protein E2562_020432 [Oryza meyeriana var. granulata]|uniref:Uncharacterized protein n=1 Tax=Oryza meyeriana var. granulata TaxID=110450 RepID=A0A6G1D5J8_9ORYZ|nr:hypothetical protein E2562_020432 [Oryza meyeriana var. granulata]